MGSETLSDERGKLSSRLGAASGCGGAGPATVMPACTRRAAGTRCRARASWTAEKSTPMTRSRCSVSARVAGISQLTNVSRTNMKLPPASTEGSQVGAIVSRHRATQSSLKRSIPCVYQESSYSGRPHQTREVSFASRESCAESGPEGAVWRRHTSTAIGRPTVSLGSWIATPLLLMINTADTSSGSNEARVGPAARRACDLPIDAARSPDAGCAPRPLSGQSALWAPEPVIRQRGTTGWSR
jgi:hypothetical protein